jgi:hypothetical protein
VFNFRQISGEIPDLSQLQSLETMDLEGNALSGKVNRFGPSPVMSRSDYHDLFLSFRDRATGEIPSSLGKMEKLEYLDLSSNQLEGNNLH